MYVQISVKRGNADIVEGLLQPWERTNLAANIYVYVRAGIVTRVTAKPKWGQVSRTISVAL